MPVSPDRGLEDVVYAAIGEVLTDEELELLVRQATGKDIYNEFAARNDPRKVKIKKTVEALRSEGNERWLLTYVLIYVAAQDRFRQKQDKLSERVVKVFPKTLIGLPQADSHVGKALDYLRVVLNTPLPPLLRFQLQPKRPSFAEILQKIVALFAYKSLQEGLLRLLFTLSYSEALLASPVDPDPNPDSIAGQIEAVVAEAPAALALLGTDVPAQSAWIAQLSSFASSLRAAGGDREATARLIDDVQRVVRLNLSRLNGEIFKAVQELSFEPLVDDPPSDVEDRQEFKDLVQAMRDLMATILARALKHKMWQDAENQMSLVGDYFELPDDAAAIANDWFMLRSRVDWLAALEPNEPWSSEAKAYTTEIDNELFKEGELDDQIRMHFHAYRKWFKGPFSKIDEAMTQDCGSLRKMDAPLQEILNELLP